MGSRAFTRNDVEWVVKIMYEDSMIVRNRHSLCLSLGISMSQLTDITRSNTVLADSNTRVFLTQILNIWISKSREPTFEKLDEVLRSEEYNSTADTIGKKLLDLPQTFAHDFEDCSAVNSLEQSRLPSIWFGVPDDVHVFTGRVDCMKELHESIIGQNLVDPLNDMTVITAVCGMGGVGKTSLTVHYAWMFVKKIYVNVIWINSESVNTITNSFKGLARELGQDTSCELLEVVREIYKYLGNSKTLIVFDNVESYDDIKSYIPKRSPNTLRPYVLLSSRKREWHLRTHLIDLDLFKVEESVEFFKSYLNLRSEQELSLAQQISIVLQNLPLAIRQAGAYIKVQHRDRKTLLVEEMKSYLETFNTNSIRILKFEHWAHTADIYENTVYSTCTVNMTKLRKQNPLTVTIMEFISYLNSDNIPVKLLYNSSRKGFWNRLVNPVIEHSQVDAAVNLLSDFSLITKHTDEMDSVSVHRLLQQVVRDQVQCKYNGSEFNWIISWIEIPLRLNNYDQYEDICLNHSLAIKGHIPTKLFQKTNVISFIKCIVSKQSNSIDQRLEHLKNLLRQEKYEEMYESYEKTRTIYTNKGSSRENNTNELFVLRFVNLICIGISRDYTYSENCDKILKHCKIIQTVIVGFHISFCDDVWRDLQQSAELLYDTVILEDNISLATAKSEVLLTVYCIFNIFFEHLKKHGDSAAIVLDSCYMMIKCLAQGNHGKKLVDFMENITKDVQLNLYKKRGVSIMSLLIQVANYSIGTDENIFLITEALYLINTCLNISEMVENEQTVFNIINLLAEIGKGQEILKLIRRFEDLTKINRTIVQNTLVNLSACIYKNSHHRKLVNFHDEMLRESLHFYMIYITNTNLMFRSLKNARHKSYRNIDCSLLSQCTMGIINCMIELNRLAEIGEFLSDVSNAFLNYCRTQSVAKGEYVGFGVVIDFLFKTAMQSAFPTIKNEIIRHCLQLRNIQYMFEKRTLYFINALTTVRKMIDCHLELNQIDDILNLEKDFRTEIKYYVTGLGKNEIMDLVIGLCEILLTKGRNSKHGIKCHALITKCLKTSKKYSSQAIIYGVDKYTVAFGHIIAISEFLLEPNLDKLLQYSDSIFRIVVKDGDTVSLDYLIILAKVAFELRQAGQFDISLEYFEYLRKIYFARGKSLLFATAGWTNDIIVLGNVIRDDACFERAMSILPGVSLNEPYVSDIV